jgi:hypothetical protein
LELTVPRWSMSEIAWLRQSSEGTEAQATSEDISRRLDVLDPHVHLRLAPVVRGVREGPAKHFDSGGLPSLSDVQHSVELRGRHGSKLLGTPVKGIIKELDNRPFVVARGHRQRFDVGDIGKSFRVGLSDVAHQLAKAHLLRIGFEIVEFARHSFGDR